LYFRWTFPNLSAMRHASFRDPSPPVRLLRSRDAIPLCSHVSRRNGRLCALTGPNPVLSSHFIPAMMPENSPVSSRHISSKNSVTGCISMKTIIKPRKPFFPSCIMDLGALASPEYPACGDTPAALPYTLAPASCARGSSQACRLPRHGSFVISSFAISSLTTE
jgi:hypothetical protein